MWCGLCSVVLHVLVALLVGQAVDFAVGFCLVHLIWGCQIGSSRSADLRGSAFNAAAAAATHAAEQAFKEVTKSHNLVRKMSVTRILFVAHERSKKVVRIS